ncbi:nucleolus protein [Thecamonas trahens ATCC 50062]|uniref:Nucleolus protein n=1 Tax=Thecamonas trahens ATCC 50062 TaxID=461836 RepID=A0A0L0D779_THETB|nr:nucleolus protein [Thecamonas trahens ATCC 50062]KNC47148.1 nucleolus protein [Thecamonas trahens ATCC 50062]|eukprot:XP_013759922.1 nucleolus protein [Thecamonas trahens ATCC 50062]
MPKKTKVASKRKARAAAAGPVAGSGAGEDGAGRGAGTGSGGGGGASSSCSSSKKKKKKKKRKTAGTPITGGGVRSRRQARALTSAFHELSHELEALRARAGRGEGEAVAGRMAEVEAKLAAMGGRKAYQDASILSTSIYSTSKWVFQIVTRMGRRPSSGEPPLRVLEVGAINTKLLVTPWLDVLAIDLLARAPGITQMDFFDVRPEPIYDVVVCAMVLNCLPTPRARGLMLVNLAALLKPRGLLFIMLPRLCFRTAYMDQSTFEAILSKLGFVIRHNKFSPKLAHYALTFRNPAAADAASAENRAATLAALAEAFPSSPPTEGKGSKDFALVFDPDVVA